MNKTLGFTLAEILIAMTVLGVIAALTVPQIMGNTSKKSAITAFKSTMANIQAAAPLHKNEKGFDFAGNRQETNGATNIRKILEDKLGAKIVKLQSSKQWLASGVIATNYEVIGSYVDSDDSSHDLKTQVFLTTDTTSNYSASGSSRTLAFGTANEEGYKYNNTFYGETLKLNNGAYVLIPPNSVGCNYENVRWDSTTSAYKTPDKTKTSNADANINLCLAFIDINGPKGPNRITSCYSNSVYISPDSVAVCDSMTEKEVADVYPVFFYDDKVAPATAAGYTILNDLLNSD